MSRIVDVLLGDPDTATVSVLVPEADYMTFEEMIELAKERNERKALDLEAAAKEARKEKSK